MTNQTLENDQNNRGENKKRTSKMSFVLHGWREGTYSNFLIKI